MSATRGYKRVTNVSHRITWEIEELDALILEQEVLAELPPSYDENSETSASFMEGRKRMISWGYNQHNTRLFYKDNDLPKFCYEIAELFAEEIQLQQLRLHKQEPGQTIPLHVDTYNHYLHRNGLSNDEGIVRYLVFLSEGGVGQFFQVEDRVLHGWGTGDVITWDKGAPHLSVNGGTFNKWTLQITGIKK
jgi:hypothetical protein